MRTLLCPISVLECTCPHRASVLKYCYLVSCSSPRLYMCSTRAVSVLVPLSISQQVSTPWTFVDTRILYQLVIQAITPW